MGYARYLIIHKTMPWYHYSHFSDEKIDTQRSEGTSLRFGTLRAPINYQAVPLGKGGIDFLFREVWRGKW